MVTWEFSCEFQQFEEDYCHKISLRSPKGKFNSASFLLITEVSTLEVTAALFLFNPDKQRGFGAFIWSKNVTVSFDGCFKVGLCFVRLLHNFAHFIFLMRKIKFGEVMKNKVTKIGAWFIFVKTQITKLGRKQIQKMNNSVNWSRFWPKSYRPQFYLVT